MIPQISSALAKGFNSKQILDYLIKKFPQYSGRIKDAMAAGFTVDQVLKFISGGKKALAKIENANAEGLTEYQQMQNRNIARREEVNKRALQGAALAATPIASGLASTALSRALPHSISHVLPDVPSSVVPTELNPNMQRDQQLPVLSQVTSNQLSAQQPPVNQVAESIPEPSNIQQPKEISNPKEYLEKKGVLNEVIDSLKKGNNPLQVAAQLGIKKTGHSKIDPEMLKNIEEFAALPKENESQNLPKTYELVEKSIEEPSIVASPQGFGEVKASRNGKSIVDVNGKKHQVEDSKLLKPPKEAAIEALELIKSFTPEEQRSTHHMLNAYDPESKQGFFVFHNGSAYVVDDISEDEYKELSEEIELAKTTGESIIGKYAAGEGSRGAAYNKVVKGVRDRKVVPELKKKFKKLQVGYNLLAEWQRLLNEK